MTSNFLYETVIFVLLFVISLAFYNVNAPKQSSNTLDYKKIKYMMAISSSKKQWKPYEDVTLQNQVQLLRYEKVIPWRRVLTHPKLEGKYDVNEARDRWFSLQKPNTVSTTEMEILPLLDEWKSVEGGRIKGLVYGLLRATNGEQIITDPIVYSTQYIVKTLESEYFELGDPIDSLILQEKESSAKKIRVADDFLNSVILSCLLLGLLSQMGILPFFGGIFGTQYKYFTSSTSSESYINTMKIINSNSNNDDEKSTNRKETKRFLIPDDPAKEIDGNLEQYYDSIANKLEELDNNIFSLNPFTLDGLLDDDQIDDDSHEDGTVDDDDYLNDTWTLF